MEEQQQNVCQEHKQKFLFICVSSECQEKQKLFCQECVTSQKHFKQELIDNKIKSLDQFLKSKQPYLDCWSNINPQIAKIYEVCNQAQGNTNVDNIDKCFSDLKAKIIEEIDKIKKNILNKIFQHSQQQQQKSQELIQKIQQNYDIQTIKQTINSLQEGPCQLETVNKNIQVFFQNNQRLQEENNIIQLYQNQNLQPIKFQEELIKNQIQPQILELIKQIEEKSIQNINIGIGKKLKFFCVTQGSHQIDENQNLIINSNGNSDNIYSDTFKKNQTVNFCFKINALAGSNFQFGLQAEKQDKKYDSFWGPNGNSLCLQTNGNLEKFEIKGVQPKEVFKVGAIFNVTICVSQNLMIIKDQENKCVISNKKQFEQNFENWVIYIRTYQKTLQILNFEAI